MNDRFTQGSSDFFHFFWNDHWEHSFIIQQRKENL